MADFIAFNLGKTLIADTGLPNTVWFGLSTKSVDGTTPFAAADIEATGSGEITGTGYARISEAQPAPASGVVAFAQKSFATGANTNWPAAVRSIVMFSATSAGTMICAWNLQSGGAARDMSAANTTEVVTPTLNVG